LSQFGGCQVKLPKRPCVSRATPGAEPIPAEKYKTLGMPPFPPLPNFSAQRPSIVMGLPRSSSRPRNSPECGLKPLIQPGPFGPVRRPFVSDKQLATNVHNVERRVARRKCWIVERAKAHLSVVLVKYIHSAGGRIRCVNERIAAAHRHCETGINYRCWSSLHCELSYCGGRRRGHVGIPAGDGTVQRGENKQCRT